MRKKSHQTKANKIWRKTASYSRVIHIYLSTCLFTLLILFCITGIVLNHLDWLDGTSNDGRAEEILPKEFLTAAESKENQRLSDMSLEGVKKILNDKYQLSAVSSIEYDDDIGEIILDYKIPGGYASAVIDTNENIILIDYRQGSAWSIMSDLHKGRHSGVAWSWVIDISAALMVLFSITGLIILFQNKKHRMKAFVFAIAGTVTPIIIYVFFVPKIMGV
ncbi:MAG: PepSY-associated TM helix domain-containing protein [Cellvibrionaceae bacterium]